MTVLEQINNQEIDNQISVAELRDAIKPGGFLDNTDNIQAVSQLLNNTESLDNTDKELINSLMNTIDNEITTILERWAVTQEDIILINVRKELLWEDDSRVQRLEELITQQNSETNQNNKVINRFNELQENEQWILKTIIDCEGIIESIDTFLNYDTKIESEETIEAVILLNRLLKEDSTREQKLKTIIANNIQSIIIKYYQDLLSNKQITYNKKEIKIIQVRGKICCNFDLIINWERWNIISSDITTNEWITNLCIRQLEHRIINWERIETEYNSSSFEELNEIETQWEIIDTILTKEILTETDINIINERNINYWWKDKYRKILVSEYMYRQLENIATKVNRNNAKNDQYYYQKNDIKIIQLYANIVYWENIIIDGKWENDIYWHYSNWAYTYDLSKNEWITNMYMCIFEIKYRKWIIDASRFKNLLNIPNIDARLKRLNNDQRKRVMDNFFKTFLSIRKSWKRFENKINWENLEELLTCLINWERYQTMNDIMNDKFLYIDNMYAMDPETYDENKIQQLKDEIRAELWKYNSPNEYYLDISNQLADEIISANWENITNNSINALYNKIQKLSLLAKIDNEILPITKKEERRQLYIEIITSNYFEKLPEQTKEYVYTLMHQDFTQNEIDSWSWAFENNKEKYIDLFISYNEDRTKRNIIEKSSKKNQNEKAYYINTESWEKWLWDWNTWKHEVEQFTKYKNLEWRVCNKVWKIVYMKRPTWAYEFTYMVENKEKWRIDNYLQYKYYDWDSEVIVNHDWQMNWVITIDEMNRYKNAINIKNVSDNIENIINKNREQSLWFWITLDLVNQVESINKNPIEQNFVEDWESYCLCKNRQDEVVLWSTLWYFTKVKYLETNEWKLNEEYTGIPVKIYTINTAIWDLPIEMDKSIAEKAQKNLKAIWGKIILNSSTRQIEKEFFKGPPCLHKYKINDFSMAKEDASWNIMIYNFTSNWEIENNTPEIIDKNTRDQINQTEQTKYSILQIPELREQLNKENWFQNIFMLQNEVNNLYKKMSWAKVDRSFDNLNIDINLWKLMTWMATHTNMVWNLFRSLEIHGWIRWWINEDEQNKIFWYAIDIWNICKEARKYKKEFYIIRDFLNKIKNDWNYWIETWMDSYISNLYDQVNTLIVECFESNWFDQFCDFFTNQRNIWSNTDIPDYIRMRLKNNWLKWLCWLGAWVLIMCAAVTWWTSLLGAAALSTLWWMIWSRWGTRLNEQIRNCRKIEVIETDEKWNRTIKWKIWFRDPTDIELVLDGTLTPQQFRWNLLLEFVQWTITTFALMKAWQIIGEAISTAFPRLAKILKPNAFNNEQYADNLFKQVLNKANNKGFINRFVWEFWEEFWEEIMESSSEYIGDKTWLKFLWLVAQIYNCLTPWPNIDVLWKSNANIDNIFVNWDICHINMCYDENIIIDWKKWWDAIKEFYESANYVYDKTTNTFKKTVKAEKENSKTVNYEIKFIPSKAPVEIRSIVNTKIWNELWITVNDETWECFFDGSKADNLRVYYEQEWWVYTENIDWTITITDKNNTTIIFRPSDVPFEQRYLENIAWRRANQVSIENKIFNAKNENEIKAILNEELSINDIKSLMFKSVSLWLNYNTIKELANELTARIDNINTIDNNTRTKIKNYIEFCTIKWEIISIDTASENVIERLNEIKNKIKFWKDTEEYKELDIEISKKKFDYYKSGNETQAANIEIGNIRKNYQELSKMTPENAMNFEYKRWLLECKLMEIQLWSKDALNWTEEIDSYKTEAQKLRDQTERIWWRTDIETLLCKIESWILIWKTLKELKPYLNQILLIEKWAWIYTLWAIIETINNTVWVTEILNEFKDNVEEAKRVSRDVNLENAFTQANEMTKYYEEQKNNLANDPNGAYEAKLKKEMEDFVKTWEVTSILQIWTNFSHPMRLINPTAWKKSPVPSIEISEWDYAKVRWILKEQNIDLSWNWWISEYSELIKNFNEAADARIRTKFWTEFLQELNSSEHRALFDYIATIFMEWRRWDNSASLTNLTEIIDINWLQDCRLHAFIKQLMFDTWKNTQLHNLYNQETTPEIEAKIRILENTNMIIMDWSFSWQVAMNNMYSADTENWYMREWKENNIIIEEHSFNLIEIPTFDGNWTITWKEVHFADSFYQWNDWKIYNLSYSANQWQNLWNMIYWKTWEWITLTTNITVIWENWQLKTTAIEIKPLSRSIQARWENIKWESIAGRVSIEEIWYLNNRYSENLVQIQEMSQKKEEIKEKLFEKLNELKWWKEINSNELEEAMRTTWWEFITEGYSIESRQWKMLKRAFETFNKIENAALKEKAVIAITTMINNMTTQQDADFQAWEQNNNSTEFIQSQWIFFNAMEIFNDVYKNEITQAEKLLDINNPDSIKRLQDAIERYQKIKNEEMGEFFDKFEKQITRELKMEKEKWWDIDGYQKYDRNNFQKVAASLKSDLEIYNHICKTLEQFWLNNEAFELRQKLRQEIKDQYKKLLENSQELLGHLIDSDNIKKELKGPQWREIYAKLKSIEQRIDKETIDFDKEFWTESSKIRELLWIKGTDTNGKEFDRWRTKDSIKDAIKNIEESWLGDYYRIIELVYNPQIEQMIMEDAVYWSIEQGYYHTETNWYVTETQNHYRNRIEVQIEIEWKISRWEMTISEALLWKDWILQNNPVLDWTSKAQINNLITEMMNNFSDVFNWDKLQEYRFYKAATESIIFQTMESDTRSMWDHWINHITWNIKRLSNYLEMEDASWNIKWNVKELQFLWYITHIFHDNWYAALISQWANHRKWSDLHPFTSKMYFETNIKPLLEWLWINTTLIAQSIESHDGINLDFSSDVNIFMSYVNISDNMALWLDKVPILRRHPKILSEIWLLYQWSKYWMNLEEWIKVIKWIIDAEITDVNEREALKSAVSELNRRSFDNVDFLSIHPRWDCEIWENWVRRINMYKASTFEIAAEMCWLDVNEINEIIEKWKEATRTWDFTKIREINEKLAWKISKDKFWNQIIKPLKDYQDNHVLANEEWKEYPKIEKKKKWKTYYEYNRDIIAADLLMWRKVQIQNWTKAENNTDYVTSSWTTVIEYSFKENSEIPNNLKEWWMDAIENQMTEYIEWITTMQARWQIEAIWETSKAMENLINAVKNKKTDISKEVNDFVEKLALIKLPTNNEAYRIELKKIIDELNNFKKAELDGHWWIWEQAYSYEKIEKFLWGDKDKNEPGYKKKLEWLIQYLIII